MSNKVNILLVLVIGVLIAVVGYLAFKYYKANKLCAQKEIQLMAALKTPKDTIIEYDTTVIIKREKVPGVSKTDTLWKEGKPVIAQTYQDTLKTKDFDLDYQISTTGDLCAVKFPYYNLHSKIVMQYRIIDTCILKPPVYLARNHFMVLFSLAANNLHSFPIVHAGISYSIKDRFAIMPGVLFNPIDQKPYGELTIGIFLDKKSN